MWGHFAARLGPERPFSPTQMAYRGVHDSRALGSQGLAFLIEVTEASGPGACALWRATQEQGARLPEVGLRVAYDEASGEDRAIAFVERACRPGPERLDVGELPPEPAFWLSRTVRAGLEPRLYLLQVERSAAASAALRYDLTLAVGHAYDLAKAYVDLMDDLAADEAALRQDPTAPEMHPLWRAPEAF
jgi:hypothetical protein